MGGSPDSAYVFAPVTEVDESELLARFGAADPWSPVSLSDLPSALVDSVGREDWIRAKADLANVMDGLSTDGIYGRALLQLVQKVPIGIDPILDRWRAAIAIDHGHWDDLRRCLEGAPFAAGELEMFREALQMSVNKIGARPTDPPLESPFAAYEFQLTGRWSWYKQWAKHLPQVDYASSRFARPDVPARHLRNRMLHHAVHMASGEAQGGRLPTAAALAREGKIMSDEGEPLRDIAADLEVLTLLAMGEAQQQPLRFVERTPSARGLSPLGTLEWILHVMPFLSLVSEDWFEATARLMQRIAGRMGSPKAQLVANTWTAAAQIGTVERPPRRTDLPAVLASARGAQVGLRVLPQLLSARLSGRYTEFQEAEKLARAAGNVWAQVSALTWMVSIDPSPAVSRRLAQLIRASGWRRPVLVPPSILSDAVLGLVATGLRGQELIELALASGKATTAAEVASRHASDSRLPEGTRALGVEALAKIGTTHARGILATVGRTNDSVGRLAHRAAAKFPGAVGLTDREVEVLDLAGHGLTNRQIAERLTLSHHTVARHLSNARDKLGAANRADAAVRLGRLTEGRVND